MQDGTDGRSAVPAPCIRLSPSFALVLLGALAPQQFTVDLGNLLEVTLHLVVVLDVVVLNPAADFRHFLLHAAGGVTASQSNGQIPDRRIALALGALAGRISAGSQSAPRMSRAVSATGGSSLARPAA